jgi:hypothetical protein
VVESHLSANPRAYFHVLKRPLRPSDHLSHLARRVVVEGVDIGQGRVQPGRSRRTIHRPDETVWLVPASHGLCRVEAEPGLGVSGSCLPTADARRGLLVGFKVAPSGDSYWTGALRDGPRHLVVTTTKHKRRKVPVRANTYQFRINLHRLKSVTFRLHRRVHQLPTPVVVHTKARDNRQPR